MKSKDEKPNLKNGKEYHYEVTRFQHLKHVHLPWRDEDGNVPELKMDH